MKNESRLTILIIEDEPIIAADLQDRLEGLGYKVVGPVAVGEEAIGLIEGTAQPPDLIIMDIQLEGEWDGIETTRRIRQKHDLPIIFLTSNSDDATFTRAKQVNPQAFLSKPFRGRDLKHAIELAIGQFTKKENKATQNPGKSNTFLLNDRLFIKVRERMQRLFFKDILWVQADDYYCKIVTHEKELLVTKTLKKFSEDLSSQTSFLRVHRSYLVNINHIVEIGELYLYIGKHKIPISRNKRELLLVKLKNL